MNWIQVGYDVEDKGASSKTSVAELEGGKLIKTVVTSIEGDVAVAQTFITVKKTVRQEELLSVMLTALKNGVDKLPMPLAMHLSNISADEASQLHILVDFLAESAAKWVNSK